MGSVLDQTGQCAPLPHGLGRVSLDNAFDLVEGPPAIGMLEKSDNIPGCQPSLNQRELSNYGLALFMQSFT